MWGAAVVGAGPAGAMAAFLLARRGVDVLLIDRAAFPRPKVCGCCLNGRAIAALEEAGLGELPRRLGAVPTCDVLLASAGASARLAMPGGVSVSRSAFDDALVREAVQAGATFLPSAEARLTGEDEGYRGLSIRRGGEVSSVHARVVLAADGLGGLLAARGGVTHAPAVAGSRIGAGAVVDAPAFFAPGTVYMACGPHGYTGLVRLEDGRLDVACAFDGAAVKRAGPAALAAANIEGAGWPMPPGIHGAAWRGTAPLTRTAGTVAARRLFVLGDAAGYVEPFTGEGMAWAIASASALAPLAAAASRDWRDPYINHWKAAHRRIVTGRQMACRLLAFTLRRPWLTSALVRVLSVCPSLAWPVLRSLEMR